VTSAFGLRADPFTHGEAFHAGVDLAAAEGEPVHAVLGGVVKAAGERGGYGQAVEIDHGDGVSTIYAHASELLVRPGDRVTPGQPIARVGHSGRATGDHLHLEVRVNGRPVEPGRALKVYARRADDPSESGS
jgi:murein DD-endopeptidase MepM/ murein hydrolase activator NlpD